MFLSLMHLYPVDGAAGRVEPNNTAASYQTSWNMVITEVNSDPANRKGITDLAKNHWDAAHSTRPKAPT